MRSILAQVPGSQLLEMQMLQVPASRRELHMAHPYEFMVSRTRGVQYSSDAANPR